MNTKPIHRAFAVGRITRNDRSILLLNPAPPPVVGPWELRAVFAR